MVTLDVETAKAPPLYERDGVVLIRGTRMPLDAVIGAYQRGQSPEEIVEAFTSLRLPDVYAVISYYLQNRETVDNYIEEQRIVADEIRRENESRWPPGDFREQLLARRRASRSSD